MKKNKRRALSIFALTMFIVNIFMSGFSIKANALEDCVKASKSINKDTIKPEEEIEVSLNVKGTPPVNVVMPNDVILIIDKSGSMGGQKISDAKEAAKNFVDLMDLTKHRVGIVDYSFTDYMGSLPLTSDKNEAKNYIDTIVDGGQTHTGNAVRKAQELLQNHRPDAQPVIIIMTDGAANFGGSIEAGFKDAKDAATDAKNAGIIFYTIALLDERDDPARSPQNAILKEMATTAQHHSFVLGSVGLNEIYKRIVKEIGIASAYDVTIKDVVSPEFEIVPGSYDSNIPKPTVKGNEISWHLLELKDQELKFNYKIRAKKDTKLGKYPVAVESKITYKDFAGAERTLNIDRPQVSIEYPAPTITEVTPNKGEITGGNEVTIKGTNFREGAKVYFDSNLATDIKVVNENEIKATVPAASQKTATLKVVNPDDKYATSSYVYWAKPAVASLTPNKGPVAGNTVVTIRGNSFVNGISVKFGDKPAKKVIYKNPTLMYAVTDAVENPGTVDVTLTNPDATEAEIVIKDGFTFEGKKEPAPMIKGLNPNEGYINEAKKVTINGENFKTGAKVKFGDKEVTDVTVNGGSSITVTVPTVDKEQVVDVVVTNGDNQECKLEKAYTYKLVPAPTISSVEPNSCYINETKDITIKGKDFQDGAKVYIGVVEATNVNASKTDSITATVPASDKVGAVDVRIVNPDGKEVKLEKAFTYKPEPEKPAPTIKQINPDKVIINTSKSISVYGENFQKGLTVKVDGIEIPNVQYSRSTYISFDIPKRSTPGSVDVEIINPDGKSVKVEKGFTYEPEPEKPAPTIKQINPDKVIINTSKNISVYGEYFQKGLIVKVDGVEIPNVQYSRSTYISFDIPKRSTPGSVDIEIINPDGKSVKIEKGFTYEPEPEKPAPTIKQINPDKVIIDTSKNISVYGEYFQKGLTVKVDGVEISNVQYSRSTYISFDMPKRSTPGSVDIEIINPDGKSVKIEKGLTYEPEPEKPAPTIKEITPNKVEINTSKNISIYGQDFQKGLIVKFDGVEVPNVQYSNPKYISFNVPSRANAGSVDVTIINPDGKEVTLPKGFTYIVPEMKIKYLSPDHGKMEGGYVVAIYGNNFASDSEVYVDGKKVDDIDYKNSSLIYIDKMPASAKEGQVDIEVRSASIGQTKSIKFTYDPKPIIPPPSLKSYCSYMEHGQPNIDIYAYNLSKNMVLKIVDTGEEITNLSTSSTYVTFKLPLSYRGKTIKAIIINKDENKESTPYEFKIN